MLIADLQDRLRILVRERIAAGEFTGTELAKRAGFRQAHVSNFLRGRRGFSIETMDRVMEAMRLEVGDLIPELRRKKAAEIEAGFEAVPVVAPSALEYLHFKKSFLRRIRSDMEGRRESWQRFALIKADKDSGVAMRPRLAPGATLLIDRHYNSLRGYRRGEPNMYVVKSGPAWPVRYVELQGSQLTLRPENQESALGFVQLGKGETYADYVVGRVAHIAVEA
jgi:transcriptional regulator with XRE-family HTH domain